jgi:ATP/maltotriose-dependent transcriptional regulator MalT
MLAQVTRELTGAVSDIRDLSQRAAAGAVQQGAAVSEIDSVLARLQALRNAVVITDGEEKRCLARLDSRLQHLAAAPDRYSSVIMHVKVVASCSVTLDCHCNL